MKKLCNFLWFLFFFGTACAAAMYWLQKRGLLRITVNYNDSEGNPTSWDMDKAVDATVEAIGGKVSTAKAQIKAMIDQKKGSEEE